MKLTLMALGGYKCYLDEKNSSLSASHYLKFSLPSPESFSTSKQTHPSSAAGGADVAEYEMTVICINFLHVEEVVNLWLDSVKILCDLSQMRPLEVSKNAIFCVKVAPISPSPPPHSARRFCWEATLWGYLQRFGSMLGLSYFFDCLSASTNLQTRARPNRFLLRSKQPGSSAFARQR
jgi:hypothetical protein